MNKLAKWLCLAAILLTAVAAYLVFSAQMSATLVSVVVENAADRLDAFRTLAEAIDRGDLDANQYRTLLSDEPSDYAFVTYTVMLSGNSPLTAEWAVLSLSPASDDVAFVPGDAQDVSPFGERAVNATLLTAASEGADVSRNMWVEYYVFGRKMTSVVENP